MADSYSYSVAWSQEDDSYVGLCTEFPSLSWMSPTYNQAYLGIQALVTDVVEDMNETGEPLPLP